MLLSPLTFTYNTAMQRNNHRALLPRLLNIRGLHPHSAHGADPRAKPLSFQQQSTSWAEDGSISTGDSKCLLVKARLFQFGIPIYFCRGRKALPHRETSEMCFFCTSFLLRDSSSWAGGAKGAVTARRSTTHTLPVRSAAGRRWGREILWRERRCLQPHALMVVIAALDRRTQPCPKPLCALVFIASRQTILPVVLPRLASSLCMPPSKCNDVLHRVLSEGVKT